MAEVKISAPSTPRRSFKRKLFGTPQVILRSPNARLTPRKRVFTGARPEVKRVTQKEFWTAETVDDPATGPSSYEFTKDITQGVTAAQRVGDAVFLKRLRVEVEFQANTTTTNNDVVMAMVEDTEPAATAPGWTDIWNGGAADLRSYLAPVPNNDKHHRFKIRRIKIVRLPWIAAVQAVGGASILASGAHRKLIWNMPINKKIWYDGTNASPYKGSRFYLFAWSTVSANTPLAFGSSQLWFTDA